MRTQHISKAMILAVCALTAGSSVVMAGSISQKPMLPVQISITPLQPGITQDTLQPGEVVEFTVKATALADTSEMRLETKLLGGAELVSGMLEWAGPAGKGEEKGIIFTVRLPLKGQGRIKATVTLLREGKRTVKSTIQYVLGNDELGKRKSEPQVKKDGKGRNIVEY